ncbi:MAG: hypothetical protein AAF674_20270 [Pseudomonadota bacterium]
MTAFVPAFAAFFAAFAVSPDYTGIGLMIAAITLLYPLCLGMIAGVVGVKARRTNDRRLMQPVPAAVAVGIVALTLILPPFGICAAIFAALTLLFLYT